MLQVQNTNAQQMFKNLFHKRNEWVIKCCPYKKNQGVFLKSPWSSLTYYCCRSMLFFFIFFGSSRNLEEVSLNFMSHGCASSFFCLYFIAILMKWHIFAIKDISCERFLCSTQVGIIGNNNILGDEWKVHKISHVWYCCEFIYVLFTKLCQFIN